MNKKIVDLEIISEQELSYLYILQYLFKKTNLQLLLICDNIDNWDDNSLFLLEKIVNKNPILTTQFSFINNITFLFSQRNDELNFLYNSTQLLQRELTRLEPHDLENVMLFFGCEKKLSENDVRNIYKASMNGHLALIHQLSQDINYRKDGDSKISYANDINFINAQLEKNLELKNLLKTISVIDNDMWGKEVVHMMEDLHQTPLFNITQLIGQAVHTNYIETSPENYFSENTSLKFTHSELQEYVKPKSEQLKRKYYNSYANSLIQTQPLDFMMRSVYSSLGGNYQFSDVLLIKHCLDIGCFNSSLIKFHHAESYKILKEFEKLSSLYLKKNLKETLRLADYMISSNKLDDLLLFEVEYVKAGVFSILINDSKLNKSIELLEKWRNSSLAEKELDINFKSNYRLIRNYLYLQKNKDVEILYDYTKNKVSEYAKYSSKAQRLSNILCRNSTIAYGLDSSYQILKNNLQELGDVSTNTPSSDYIQYFYSLINLADVCAYTGKYNEGEIYASLACELLKNNVHNLSHKSATNNYIINCVCKDRSKAANFIPLMESLVDDKSILQDNIILSTNLASLYISCNKYEKANELYNKVFKIINRYNYQVNNHIYKVTVNYATLKYLQGHSKNAIELMNSVKNIYSDTYSNSFISTRHNNLETIFKNLKVDSLQELDSYLFKNHNQDLAWYDEWIHYNKGLIWWGIQHWSFN